MVNSKAQPLGWNRLPSNVSPSILTRLQPYWRKLQLLYVMLWLLQIRWTDFLQWKPSSAVTTQHSKTPISLNRISLRPASWLWLLKKPETGIMTVDIYREHVVHPLTTSICLLYSAQLLLQPSIQWASLVSRQWCNNLFIMYGVLYQMETTVDNIILCKKQWAF